MFGSAMDNAFGFVARFGADTTEFTKGILSMKETLGGFHNLVNNTGTALMYMNGLLGPGLAVDQALERLQVKTGATGKALESFRTGIFNIVKDLNKPEYKGMGLGISTEEAEKVLSTFNAMSVNNPLKKGLEGNEKFVTELAEASKGLERVTGDITTSTKMIMEFDRSLGIAPKNMKAFTEHMANIYSQSGMSNEQFTKMTQNITKLGVAYGMQGEQAKRFVDDQAAVGSVLNKLGFDFEATMSKLNASATGSEAGYIQDLVLGVDPNDPQAGSKKLQSIQNKAQSILGMSGGNPMLMRMMAEAQGLQISSPEDLKRLASGGGFSETKKQDATITDLINEIKATFPKSESQIGRLDPVKEKEFEFYHSAQRNFQSMENYIIAEWGVRTIDEVKKFGTMADDMKKIAESMFKQGEKQGIDVADLVKRALMVITGASILLPLIGAVLGTVISSIFTGFGGMLLGGIAGLFTPAVIAVIAAGIGVEVMRRLKNKEQQLADDAETRNIAGNDARVRNYGSKIIFAQRELKQFEGKTELSFEDMERKSKLEKELGYYQDRYNRAKGTYKNELTPPAIPDSSNQDQFYKALAKHEGYNLQGSVASRNLNPGNLTVAGFERIMKNENETERNAQLLAQAQKQGASGYDLVTHGGKTRAFLKFNTEEEGFGALQKQVGRYLKDNPNMTAGQFIAKYSPASDGNNQQSYLKALGFSDPNQKIADVLNKQAPELEKLDVKVKELGPRYAEMQGPPLPEKFMSEGNKLVTSSESPIKPSQPLGSSSVNAMTTKDETTHAILVQIRDYFYTQGVGSTNGGSPITAASGATYDGSKLSELENSANMLLNNISNIGSSIPQRQVGKL